MLFTPSLFSACSRWFPFGVQLPPSFRIVMMGSRKEPTFSITVIAA